MNVIGKVEKYNQLLVMKAGKRLKKCEIPIIKTAAK